MKETQLVRMLDGWLNTLAGAPYVQHFQELAKLLIKNWSAES